MYCTIRSGPYLLALGLAVIFAVPVHSADGDDRKCEVDWRGRWQISAEGVPVQIYEIARQKHSKELIGKLEKYADSRFSLTDVELAGQAVILGLDSVICNGRSAEIVRRVEGGSSTVRLSLAESSKGWMEIAGLPDGVRSPKFLLTKVESKATLKQHSNMNDSLIWDVWTDAASFNLPSSVEMRKIFQEDQDFRQSLHDGGGFKSLEDNPDKLKEALAGDLRRRTETRRLISEGKLSSGVDYYRAAFVFHHGSIPSDYLYAHHLATVALSKGYTSARWIAAATLDRYLQSIGQSQIYGSQLSSSQDGKKTIEPIDRSLLSDADRNEMGMPALEETEKLMKAE